MTQAHAQGEPHGRTDWADDGERGLLHLPPVQQRDLSHSHQRAGGGCTRGQGGCTRGQGGVVTRGKEGSDDGGYKKIMQDISERSHIKKTHKQEETLLTIRTREY